MVEIFGFEVDLVSLIPAIFGVLLSIYNWLQMRKPADIHPNEIINYGLISAEFNGEMLLCLPLVFDNEGAKKGLIKRIKVGFRDGEVVKYLTVYGKAILNEMQGENMNNIDYDKFDAGGYRVIQPTYPIVVEAGESKDIILIAAGELKENIIRLDKQITCVIEVFFGKGKLNKIEFPFLLAKEDVPDNKLVWLEPLKQER